MYTGHNSRWRCALSGFAKASTLNTKKEKHSLRFTAAQTGSPCHPVQDTSTTAALSLSFYFGDKLASCFLPFTECSHVCFGLNRRILYAAAHISLSGQSYACPPGNCCPSGPPGNRAQSHLSWRASATGHSTLVVFTHRKATGFVHRTP